MTIEKQSIGFVGLGLMGFGMATNLVKQGYTVKGYDISEPTLARFKAAGRHTASSPGDAASGNLFCVCMVATTAQAQAVIFDHENGIAKALPNGATLILCSTVPAMSAQSFRDQLVSIGREDVHFIDAPVSGGARKAGEGTLTIMAGGSDAALERGKFLLEEMSDTHKLYLVPGGIGAGSNMKMIHQVLAAIHILAASEVMGLAAHLGLNANEAAEALMSSDAWSFMHENRCERMLIEDYYPGSSAVTIILKDVAIVTAAARLHSFPTPLCGIAEQTFLTALPLGFGGDDDASLVRLYYRDPITKADPKASLNPERNAAALKLIVYLLTNIHLVAAAEAISFARLLKVDLPLVYDVVNAAAGASKIFKLRGAEMMSGLTGGVDGDGGKRKTINEAIAELAAVVQGARDVNCPLHLGNAALNILYVARKQGLGEEADSHVLRVYEHV
ncbi:3-hydroxyisobutyrate dehydrogenase, variant 2 [Blastomyces dermatitidis ATCC 26199]|nr:3-hydroxyisobutyrate dehydrogenase [Blastomyces dermatitidis ATCC 26199]EQL35310.1 3-hydroxyisobutyrate dehydrogenase, variant 1 [Blastomyces dermatitidis ATCC 26199]EQL35311.1 3-hydroxyisobutyrate dehydrogenase, variant 2 [Blastomyces dermatitidis ATCC 26199]